MTVAIKPAVFRDASYVTANLRPEDKLEAFCQLPPDATSMNLAWWLVMTPEHRAFVAYIDDEPVALFGTSPMTPYCYSLFALGTDRMHRAVPEISRFLMTVHIERRIAEGALTMEARSHIEHVAAHRWMLAMGAEQHGPSFPWGGNGEHFLLFRWTVAGYRAIREKRWSD